MTDVKKQYGHAIRQRRHELGWSQEYLAAQAGLHRTYIADIERGERNVSLENIIRLTFALQLTPGEFFSQYFPQEASRES